MTSFLLIIDSQPCATRAWCRPRSLARSLQQHTQWFEQESDRLQDPSEAAVCFVMWKANVHPVLEYQRKSEHGSVQWYFLVAIVSLPALCVCVYCDVYTVRLIKIATKLEYDEHLSWRENWSEQTNNIWDLRCCVLFEVTVRC